MLAGLQGSGKTTFAGKLAKQLEKDGHTPFSSPPTCSARTPNSAAGRRPAGRRRDLRARARQRRRRPREGRPRRVDYARQKQHDVVIIDTAGRSASTPS
jgi:signal recognition particle subunit SRP54